MSSMTEVSFLSVREDQGLGGGGSSGEVLMTVADGVFLLCLMAWWGKGDGVLFI